MTKEQAIELSESGFWEHLTPRQVAEFQMSEKLICMPFSVFHEALEESLGRPVFTHELGMNIDGIKAELFGGKPAPSLREIIDLIPREKLALVSIRYAEGEK